MQIQIDDPARPDVFALLEEHLRNMHELSPPESVHALDVSKLKGPDITFWTVRDGNVLLGCGALKELDATHGEVKSMRTPAHHRRREGPWLSAAKLGDRIDGRVHPGAPAV
jgi:putative acetyltransferase